MLLLPATHLRQHRVAGAAARSVKSSITGLPEERSASRVRVSPWRPEGRSPGPRAYRKPLCLVEGGAVLGWRYAAARGKAFLQGLQAHQKPPVLPQQMHQEPPLSGQEGEHEYPAQEAQQLGRREGSEPGERAGPDSAFVALPEDEGSHGCEGSVAGEGLPAGRGGVQLPKAVALGLRAASQVDGDPTTNTEQQPQRPQSTPPGRRRRQEGGGDASSARGSNSPEGASQERPVHRNLLWLAGSL